MQIVKRNGSSESFDIKKVYSAVQRAFRSAGRPFTAGVRSALKKVVMANLEHCERPHVEDIQNIVELFLMRHHPAVAKSYIIYREQHRNVRDWVQAKKDFISRYKSSDNTANATVDDNSNVGGKNIGVLNCEIHKTDNIKISRGMMVDKLRTLYPDFDAKQYVRDLENHIIYKHDESGFAGAVSPYCASISMYPFLTDGIRRLGGLSAAPKNLDSFCGMYINLIFAAAA